MPNGVSAGIDGSSLRRLYGCCSTKPSVAAVEPFRKLCEFADPNKHVDLETMPRDEHGPRVFSSDSVWADAIRANPRGYIAAMTDYGRCMRESMEG